MPPRRKLTDVECDACTARRDAALHEQLCQAFFAPLPKSKSSAAGLAQAVPRSQQNQDQATRKYRPLKQGNGDKDISSAQRAEQRSTHGPNEEHRHRTKPHDTSPSTESTLSELDRGYEYIMGSAGANKEEENIVPMVELTSEMRELEGEFEILTRSSGIEKANRLSRSERKAKGYVGCSDVGYGEVTFEMVARAIATVRQLHGGLRGNGTEVFYDLGSGAGKAIFAAAMVHRWKSVNGIELLESLHQEARTLYLSWEARAKRSLPDRRGEASICLIRGDFEQFNWDDATLVFANSTLFSKHVMSMVEARSRSMQVGSFFISTTKKLPNDFWQVVSTHRGKMSFGKSHVYIHQKVK